MKGISYCAIRRKLELLGGAKANLGLDDFRFYLRVPPLSLTPCASALFWLISIYIGRCVLKSPSICFYGKIGRAHV